MIISMNWISEFVDLEGIDIRELINRVTLSTAEVENVYEMGKDIENVVVGEILSIEDHPESSKLHVLKVNNGSEIVECVCGADNIFVGAKVPFAKVNGRLKDKEIKAVMKGSIMSYGMCCSEKELGISDNNDGVMILDDWCEVGTDIKKILDIEDILFEIDNKSLTNRPDLWGHYGFAREIAALTGRTLKPLDLFDITQYNNLNKVCINIERKDKVYRYSCITIENITKNISPANMRIRLYYCGMRSINLLTDLTNYVMLEVGQPMHAFDNAKVKSITVKTFDKPFRFRTLDEMERDVDADTLMICNENEPVAIAGIIGGKDSEIRPDTTSVLLESANFDGVSIRKTALRLGIRTDASARFEKMIDPEMTTVAIQRFLKLLSGIDDGIKVTSSMTDLYIRKYEDVYISFDKSFVDKYTGIDIPEEKIVNTLIGLGFSVEKKDGGYVVKVPSFRATKDVTIKADIIEEITRIYGYDNFELKSTQSYLVPVRKQQEREVEYQIKEAFAVKFGLSEIHSYIWYDKKMNKKLGIEAESEVRIINSLTAEYDTIRSTMAPTLLCTVKKNIDSFDDVNIFEIGRVAKGFRADGLCDERKIIGCVLAGKNRSYLELLAKGKEMIDYIAAIHKNKAVEYKRSDKLKYNWVHRKNSAIIILDGAEIGYITQVSPRICDNIDKKVNAVLFEIDYDLFSMVPPRDIEYVEPSKYPGIEMDLSLVIDKEDDFKRIADIISSCEYEYLLGYTLIDVFTDEKNLGNKKSVTVRFKFGSDERTLLNEEVKNYMNSLINTFKERGIDIKS